MITHVAIKDVEGRVWSLPKPNRHGDVIKLIQQQPNWQRIVTNAVAGFLNDQGVFLDRTEAWFEAHKGKQILPPYNPVNPSQRAGKPSEVPGQLFSEDIW